MEFVKKKAAEETSVTDVSKTGTALPDSANKRKEKWGENEFTKPELSWAGWWEAEHNCTMRVEHCVAVSLTVQVFLERESEGEGECACGQAACAAWTTRSVTPVTERHVSASKTSEIVKT